MAKNQHRNLTGDALHNPKGFDGASNGTKPVKGGGGALDWITETQLPKALDYVSAQSAPPTEVAGDVYLIDTTGTAYDINTIAWQSGNTIRIAFNGSPDLSAVAADDYFITSGNGNSSNDGTFIITTVNDGSDYIEITNNDRSDATDDEATDAVGTGYYTLAEWDAVSKISHVTFDGSIWSSITPSEGQSCYDVTLGAIRVFDGTDWSSSLTTGGISGSGTTNYLARWTPSGSALGNSVVQDNGSTVGINTSPLAETDLTTSRTSAASTASASIKTTISGSNTNTTKGIDITASNTSSGTVWGTITDISTSGTSNLLGHEVKIDTSGSGTITANAAYYVNQLDAGGTTTVSNAYGLLSDGVGGSGTTTNAYHLYLTAHSSGTNKYGIYQAGANDKNYFAGAMQFDTAAAATGYVWTATDADGNGDWAVAASGGLSDVVDDITPQLGGSLDVNGQKIVSVAGGNIDIEPNGTGNVLLGNFTFDADQTVGAGQDNYVLTYDNATGLISLEAAAGGGTSFFEETTSSIKIDNTATTRDILEVSSDAIGSTLGGAFSAGALIVGTTHTASGGGRRFIMSGLSNNASSNFIEGGIISGTSNTYTSGDYSHTFGSSNTMNGDASLVTGTSNIVNGSNSFIAGSTNTVNNNDQAIIGWNQKLQSGVQHQIAIGQGQQITSNHNNKGIFFAMGSARPNISMVNADSANAMNMAMGSYNSGRTLDGAGLTGSGGGVFYFMNGQVVEPTVNLGDATGIYGKDRTATKSGIIIKAEDGTKHFLGDFSAIGGDETVATANKTLTVKGTGTGSGTSSLKTTDSAGTTTLEVKDDGRISAYGKYLEVADNSTANTLGTFINQSIIIGDTITAGGALGSISNSMTLGHTITIGNTSNINDSLFVGRTLTVGASDRSIVMGNAVNIADAEDSFVAGKTITGTSANLVKSFIFNTANSLNLPDTSYTGLTLIGSSQFGFEGDNSTAIGGDHYSTDNTLSQHYAFGDNIRGTVNRQTVIGMGADSGAYLQVASGASNGVHFGVASSRTGFGLVKATAKSLTTTATETTGLAYLGTGLPVSLNVANTGDGALWIENADTVPTATISGAGALYVEGGALKFRGGSGTVTTLASA